MTPPSRPTAKDAGASDDWNTPFPTISMPSFPLTSVLSDDFGSNIADEMAVVHNAIIRSLNAIWHNAPLVSPRDVPAFIAYSKMALATLHEHHHTEEEIFFPVLAKEGLAKMVDGNVEQHKAFDDAMKALDDYLQAVEQIPAEYDAEKLRKFLNDLGGPLVKHLHEEIATLQPEIMNKIDKQVLDKVCKDLDAHIKARGGFTTSLPFMITAHKIDDAPAWPPLPGPLRWLAKNIFSRVHSSWWKFAPYDLSGKPQQYTRS